MLLLNNSNYYSQSANEEYFSNSQIKDFLKCEAYAMAKIRGEWVEEPTEAMLIGSYIDSYFEGTLEIFKERTPAIFNKDGSLKAKFQHAADVIIKKIEADDLFMLCLSGEKQVIMTSELFGAPFKIKMDSYLKEEAIVDLKIVKKIREIFYSFGGRVSFIEKNGYDMQLAIYQEVVRRNTGLTLDCIIAAADKQEYPDIECVLIENDRLNFQLEKLKNIIPRLIEIKAGNIEPAKCGVCPYCRATKKLEGLSTIYQLIA